MFNHLKLKGVLPWLLVLTVFLPHPQTASAWVNPNSEHELIDVTVDDLKYQVAYEHFTNFTEITVTLVDVLDTHGSEVTIPETIQFTRSNGFTYTELVKHAKKGVFSNDKKLETLTINAPLEDADGMCFNCPNLKEVRMYCTYTGSGSVVFAPCTTPGKWFVLCDGLEKFTSLFNNPDASYKAYNNVLYLGDKIVAYPPAAAKTTYQIANAAGSISDYAFANLQHLKEFTLASPSAFTIVNGAVCSNSEKRVIAVPNLESGKFVIPAAYTVADGALTAPGLKEFALESEMEYYDIINGAYVFKTTTVENILAYPRARETKMFTISQSIGQIADYAFYGAPISDIVVASPKASANWAACLKENTNVYLTGTANTTDNLAEYKNLHDNTFALFDVKNKEINTASYDFDFETPQGVNVKSVKVIRMYQEPDAKPETCAVKGKHISVTDLVPDQSYSMYVTLDINGEEYSLEETFKTEAVVIEEIESTQSTATVKVALGNFKNFTNGRIGCESGEKFDLKSDGTALVKNLKPGRESTVSFGCSVGNEGFICGSAKVKTKSLNVSCVFEAGPTSINVTGQWDEGDAKITDYYFTLNKKRVGGGKMKSAVITGLDPEQFYSVEFIVEVPKYNTWDENYQYPSGAKTVTTKKLELNTLAAKAVSNDCALIASSTNIVNGEKGTGFEWRRYDAPETMPSQTVPCPVYDGNMAGRMSGLSATTYYNYRPYYTSDSGKTYYGDWITFITADAYVYFEPVVYTFEPTVTRERITFSGFGMAGSDAVTSRGFEYWMVSQRAGAPATLAENEKMTITVDSEFMTASIDNFEFDATYRCRSFVATENGITYGSEVEFDTPELNGVQITGACEPTAMLEVAPGALNLKVTALSGTAQLYIVSLQGQLILNKEITADGDWQNIPVNAAGPVMVMLRTSEMTKVWKVMLR